MEPPQSDRSTGNGLGRGAPAARARCLDDGSGGCRPSDGARRQLTAAASPKGEGPAAEEEEEEQQIEEEVPHREWRRCNVRSRPPLLATSRRQQRRASCRPSTSSSTNTQPAHPATATTDSLRSPAGPHSGTGARADQRFPGGTRTPACSEKPSQSTHNGPFTNGHFFDAPTKPQTKVSSGCGARWTVMWIWELSLYATVEDAHS